MSNTLLKTCLKIYGVNNADIGRQLGFSRSYVQKIVIGLTYKTTQGPKKYRNKKIENALAASLGLTYDQLWGKNSDQYLRKAIEQVLEKQMLSYSVSQDAQQVNVNA